MYVGSILDIRGRILMSQTSMQIVSANKSLIILIKLNSLTSNLNGVNFMFIFKYFFLMTSY